jgi:DNA invertase Pin-like site-specific DNA recombinase
VAASQPRSGWATYLRVSNEDKQKPEVSFSVQRSNIEQFLLSGSPVAFRREYRDILTGTDPNRVDYQQMLADARAGRFSHLGLYRADRFGRDATEGLQAATQLIGLGIKIRVANMPSLMPETPDGFFIFLLQMGLAQREVDVLRERTMNGIKAKLLMGGWPNKAPEGYVNKEKQLSSNKYHRWVELDPDYGRTLREAWDMLLSGCYTLLQICEALTARGYVRDGGRPWAWTDSGTGERRNSKNRLHAIFHNPFYAGWVVSEKFEIPYGTVRGDWEPIVTTQEFERGIAILHKNDREKSREKRHVYILRNLVYVQANGRQHKLYGTSPSGRSQIYAYYATSSQVNDRQIHIPCEMIEGQLPEWLKGIALTEDTLPYIREVYQGHIEQVAEKDHDTKLSEVNRRIAQLREEEARIARLFVSGQVTEDAYAQLRMEWQDKLKNIEIQKADLERTAAHYLNDLDVALILLVRTDELFARLNPKQQATVLQILIERLVVDEEGTIVGQKLRSPFTYLTGLASQIKAKRGRPRKLTETDQVRTYLPHYNSEELGNFLASLRFDQRGRVDELPINFRQGTSENANREWQERVVEKV